MTPVDFARSVAAHSSDPEDQALGVAIITRGLTDDDVHYRQGWPLDETTVEAACKYLGLTPMPELVARALALAPTLSDAILNKAAR